VDELTEEQRRIVDLPVDARAIVVAGPGTGKTYTLVRRVAKLVRTNGIAAGNELLVLTFTNAVLDELHARLAEHEDSAYVRPSTIDSFAGRLVERVSGEGPTAGYDATVGRAATLVREDPEAAGISRIRHVVVDEIQDLVGVRLQFVEAILDHAGGGFTVLGDPAQGIYGFQDRGSVTDAVAHLCNSFPDASQYSLTQNHRARNAEVDVAHTHREALLPSASGSESLRRMVRRLLDCDHVTVDQLAILLHGADARTGVLCRTNGEVLMLSDALSARGVRHQVRRASEASVPPRWIAEVLRDVAEPELARETFDRLVESHSALSGRAAWRRLRRVAPGKRGNVDMSRLRERIASVGQEREVPELPVLSTIHRSKGLEYDRTVIQYPEIRDAGGEDEEARVLFVAMTRSRNATLVLERQKLPGRLAIRGGRWILVTWRESRLMKFEVKAGDVGTSSPAGADDDPAFVQQHLRGQVQPGDAVQLVRRADEDAFDIVHQRIGIGRTAPALSAFLRRYGRLPVAIEGVRVDCVRSVAGDPARTANLGIGSAGLWLAPELVGFGRPRWKDSGDG
jgi:hypothetical protein